MGAVQAENMCFGPLFANICSSQDCFMGSFGGFDDHQDGFCFQEVQPFDQQAMELHRYDDQYLGSSSTSSFSRPVEILQSLSSDLEKQRLEMDWLLQLENKRLRRSILQEQTRQQSLLLHKYESTIKTLMLQKDEQISSARNKTAELQAFLSRAEMEAKAWEKKARENEALVNDLNNRLNQAHEEDDHDYETASFCGSCTDQDKITGEEKMGCKLCQARRSCVVLLPCRHLCCCKFCETLLGHCPVCQTVKQASLEAFLV